MVQLSTPLYNYNLNNYLYFHPRYTSYSFYVVQHFIMIYMYIAVHTPQRRHLYAQARESKRPRMRTQMKTLLKGTMADAISN